MLQEILNYDVYRIMIIFVRISGIFLQLPFYSEQTVNPQVRLIISLFIALTLTPLVTINLPAQPVLNEALILLVLSEATIGLFIGICFRFFFEILQMAGLFISIQTGYNSIQFLAPGLITPASPHSVLLTLVGLAMVIGADVHLVMIQVIINSYTIFPPGEGVMFADMAEKLIDIANTTFVLAFQISAVFFVIFIPLNFYFGIIGRLMPQVQSQILLLPLQVLVGGIVFSLLLPAMMRGFFIEFDKIFEVFGVFR